MARGERKRRKLLQTRPSTARERLLAAEVHISELVAQQQSLEAAVRESQRLVEATLEQQTAQVEQQLQALVAQAREDYRKQVGVLDVVRRQQKRQDEEFSQRLAATESTLAGAAENSRERLASLELRTDAVEALAQSTEQRAARAEGVGAELTTLAARLDEMLRTMRHTVEVLGTRADAVEATLAADLAGVAEVREQILMLRQTAAQTAAQTESTVRAIADEMAGLSGQVTATIGMLAPLGDVPTRLERFAEDLQRFSDRLTATEQVVNQASDLEMQLERAEEFERLMAEVDPATYATKADLDRLRVDLRPQGDE
ncbi:MAG: hypothetical protein RL219_550 [Actinomycetota bacterium]|jgi:chromosome segregation ATPase